MEIGIVGLGRMGGNILRRLARNGHQCIGYDQNKMISKHIQEPNTEIVFSLKDLINKLKKPRIIWFMLPEGEITEQTINDAMSYADFGDIFIDGGNTYYRDDIRRTRELQKKGIEYVDVGTSGGVWGLERGYCMMIGGPSSIVKKLDPIFQTLAPGVSSIPKTKYSKNDQTINQETKFNIGTKTEELGYLHCGSSGSGHFVKMIHNGIEYGLMQAYAEGFEILKKRSSDLIDATERFELDVSKIAEVWRRGSVISSWLLDLIAQSLNNDPNLINYTGKVSDSGEGRWTLEAAIEQAVSAPVISSAVFSRFRSRQENTFGEKLLSAMREGFGGHTEPTA